MDLVYQPGKNMGIRDIFKRKTKPKAYVQNYNISYSNTIDTTNPFKFADIPEEDFDLRREQSREVYRKSIIAKNIVQRISDNAIHTGLTWESSPIWALIEDAPENKEDQKKITSNIENLWKLYAKSKEDHKHFLCRLSIVL